jgi:hypothetical protein
MNRVRRLVKIALVAISLCSGLGFFLSLWIVVPAPIFALLPLAVGAPEVSPWLIVGNTIAALLALSQYQHPLGRIALVASVVGLLLSSLPLSQLPAAQRAMTMTMQQNLGIEDLRRVINSISWNGALRNWTNKQNDDNSTLRPAG